MGWWSRLLDRLTGAAADEPNADWEQEPAAMSRSDEPQVFECQTCFKIFDSKQPGALCPECDSPDVIALSR
jgi:Zn finger protein HypA/HybF involved in hydrogenase expression